MANPSKLRESLRTRLRKISEATGDAAARERLKLSRWLLENNVLDRAAGECDRALEECREQESSEVLSGALALATRIQLCLGDREGVLELAQELEARSEQDPEGCLEAQLAHAQANLEESGPSPARPVLRRAARTLEGGKLIGTEMHLRWCNLALTCGMVPEAETGFALLQDNHGLEAATSLARIALSRDDPAGALEKLAPWSSRDRVPASPARFAPWLAAQRTATHARSFEDPGGAWKAAEALDQIVQRRTRTAASVEARIRKILAELEDERLKNRDREQVEIEADRMNSLGTLVTGVAHEINNPNHFIMLNVPYLREAWKDASQVLADHAQAHPEFRIANAPFHEVTGEISEVIHEIQQGAERIKTIVSELRSYTQPIDTTQGEATDLNDALRRAVRLLAPQLRVTTNHFHVDYGTEVPPIEINKRRIEQVLVSLLLNACQAMDSTEERIEVRTFAHGGETLLEIKDQGCGIPPENLRQVLDPFFTTRREDGGTGMGLAISNQIVTRAGGSLEIESEPGSGTTVLLRFPARSEAD